MQPAHPVPAFVQDLTSPKLLQLPSLTTLLISPFVTLWHEQIWVSSSLASLSKPPVESAKERETYKSSGFSSPSVLAPSINCEGGISKAFLDLTIPTSLI